MSQIIDPDSYGPAPRHERILLDDFYLIPPFPGHRDSEKRAMLPSSDHLNKFNPQHAEVELAECPDGKGGMLLYRLTGNTRAWKWFNDMTDFVPRFVNATIYWCRDVAAISAKGLLLDSPKAAWKGTDFTFRAFGMEFADEWRPQSALVKKGGRAIQMAYAYLHGYLATDRGVMVEHALPTFRREVRILDEMCQQQLVIENGNFSVGMQAAMLLLLKFEDESLLRMFMQMVFGDMGTKTALGMDAVQCMADTIKQRGRRRGRPTRQIDIDDVRKVLTCYVVFENDDQARFSRTPTRIDPVTYCKTKMRTASRAARSPIHETA